MSSSCQPLRCEQPLKGYPVQADSALQEKFDPGSAASTISRPREGVLGAETRAGTPGLRVRRSAPAPEASRSNRS